MGVIIEEGTPLSPSGSTGKTAQMIARTRDLVGEETADLFSDANEILPALNDGKDVIFSTSDVLLRDAVRALTASVSAYALDDLGRMVFLKHRTGTAGAYAYTDLIPIAAERVEDVIGLSAGTPKYYTTDIPAADGSAQITVYPEPAAGITGHLVGQYYAIPPDLAIETTPGTGQDPEWHIAWHFLPCYHAASILLRKDRRPEAALEMENKFRSGIIQYERWLQTRRPYMADAVRSQPSPNDGAFTVSSYPYEIG
jgi:hypothetical protein